MSDILIVGVESNPLVKHRNTRQFPAFPSGSVTYLALPFLGMPELTIRAQEPNPPEPEPKPELPEGERDHGPAPQPIPEGRTDDSPPLPEPKERND